MKQFEFLVGLRKEILYHIDSIENAKSWLPWDNAISNYSARQALINTLERYINAAAEQGLLVVTRHCSCPNRRHGEYPTNNRYGYDIPYQSNDFLWEGDHLYQGNRICICPCSSRNEPSNHSVIDDFVFKRDADLIFCRQISSVFSDIQSAIENSSDKQPRSGIREYLLRSLLTLNDAILPQTVEEYIGRRVRSDGETHA